jgi:type II secretion system protein C
MNIVSNKVVMATGMILLVLVIIAKVIGLVMLGFLPHEGIDKIIQKSVTPTYHRYNLKNMIVKPVVAVVKKEEVAAEIGPDGKAISPDAKVSAEISDLILTGMYGTSTGGYVFIAKKSMAKKTELLSVGESFAGYKLVKIRKDAAIFSKGGKNYSLSLEKFDLSKYMGNTKNFKGQKAGATVPKRPVQKVKKASGPAGEQVVSKKEIKYYAKNFKEIWKDIAMNPHKKNGKMIGFKVMRIRAGSPFAKLGLQKNDIITKANNQSMTSFKDAIKIYEGIDKLDAIELTLIRDNQEKEIVYEIR